MERGEEEEGGEKGGQRRKKTYSDKTLNLSRKKGRIKREIAVATCNTSKVFC